MQKDECILLDDRDNVIGHANKYDTHRFSAEKPRGTLHRAFSVFLFDEAGRLLLQQRAAEKITFPNVWTNTCCSHPLFGYEPTEVDTPADVANASVMGASAAAVRKLKHELGIEASDVPIEGFKFLTRLHYYAADVITHGKYAEWGEHEIDYILFIQTTAKLAPNPEEVSDTKYVTLPELQQMMAPSSGLLWSPWFRIIVEQFLVKWWADVRTTITTDKFVDVKNIHFFAPPRSSNGGAGTRTATLLSNRARTARCAGPGARLFRSFPCCASARNLSRAWRRVRVRRGVCARRQVKIFKEGKLKQLMHPAEIWALARYKARAASARTSRRRTST